MAGGTQKKNTKRKNPGGERSFGRELANSLLSLLPLAAAAGAWLNGRAGEIAQSRMGDVSMTAGDTVQALPEALRELRKVSKLI
jgi:hypothetical protein